MKNVFIAKAVTAPEDYLETMLDRIDESGGLDIARSISEDAFCPLDAEKYSHVETVKLDKSLVCFDELLDCYNNVIAAVESGTFSVGVPKGKELGKYGERLNVYAKRISALIELGAPEIIVKWEKCMLMDSIVLYKTKAVGVLYEKI